MSKLIIEVSTELIGDEDFAYTCLCLYDSLTNYKRLMSEQYRMIRNSECWYLVDFLNRYDDSVLAWIDYDRKLFHKRKKRIQGRVQYMVEEFYPVFVTLTFTDNVLNTTTFHSRRKRVQRFLSHFSFYIANVDFGKLNGREHYHAVVSGRVDPKWWESGNIDMEYVRNRSNDSAKVAKYVAKLTNHAVKATVQRHKVLYSENFSRIGL